MHVSEGLIERPQGSRERRLHIAAVLPQLALQLPLEVPLQVAPTLGCGDAGDDCCEDMVLVCLRQPGDTAQTPCLVCTREYAPGACQPHHSAMTGMFITSEKPFARAYKGRMRPEDRITAPLASPEAISTWSCLREDAKQL